MEYVVYLSDSKIDMLYDQINRAEAETETEGEIKLGFFTIKRSRKRDNKLNRFEKLDRVTTALMNRIGSPFDEKIPSYVSDTLSMTWRSLEHTKQATYWIGEGGCKGIYTKLLLIGSTKNVIGEDPEGSDSATHSSLMHFLNAFRKEFEIPDNGYAATYISLSQDKDGNAVKTLVDASEFDPSRMIDILYNSTGSRRGFYDEYTFLAKVLTSEEHHDKYGRTERYIIATPLYVSLAEKEKQSKEPIT